MLRSIALGTPWLDHERVIVIDTMARPSAIMVLLIMPSASTLSQAERYSPTG